MRRPRDRCEEPLLVDRRRAGRPGTSQGRPGRAATCGPARGAGRTGLDRTLGSSRGAGRIPASCEHASRRAAWCAAACADARAGGPPPRRCCLAARGRGHSRHPRGSPGSSAGREQAGERDRRPVTDARAEARCAARGGETRGTSGRGKTSRGSCAAAPDRSSCHEPHPRSWNTCSGRRRSRGDGDGDGDDASAANDHGAAGCSRGRGASDGGSPRRPVGQAHPATTGTSPFTHRTADPAAARGAASRALRWSGRPSSGFASVHVRA